MMGIPFLEKLIFNQVIPATGYEKSIKRLMFFLCLQSLINSMGYANIKPDDQR